MEGRFPSMELESESGCQLYKNVYAGGSQGLRPQAHRAVRARILGVSESSHDVRMLQVTWHSEWMAGVSYIPKTEKQEEV